MERLLKRVFVLHKLANDRALLERCSQEGIDSLNIDRGTVEVGKVTDQSTDRSHRLALAPAHRPVIRAPASGRTAPNAETPD